MSVGDKAREHVDVAIATLVEIAQNDDEGGAARVAAANALLDRAYGKPASATVVLPADPGAVNALVGMSDELLLQAVAAGRIGARLLAAGMGGGSTPQNEGPVGTTVRDTRVPPLDVNTSPHVLSATGKAPGTPPIGTFPNANGKAPAKIPSTGLFAPELDELAT